MNAPTTNAKNEEEPHAKKDPTPAKKETTDWNEEEWERTVVVKETPQWARDRMANFHPEDHKDNAPLDLKVEWTPHIKDGVIQDDQRPRHQQEVDQRDKLKRTAETDKRKILVHDECFLPCAHLVRVHGEAAQLMYAEEIVGLFKRHGLRAPEHFGRHE